MRLPTLLATLFISTTLSIAAPISLQMSDSGVVRLSDDALLAEAILAVHGPGWSMATIGPGTESQRQDDTVQGSLPLPANCKGNLDYTAAARVEGDAAVLDYSVQFTETTDIQGAQVSFMLPCSRFEGKQASLLPKGATQVLPAEGGSVGLSGSAAALAVDLGDGTRLVIASHALGAVMVQDNRQYGADQYEARFSIFSQGPVGPGMLAARRFSIAIVPEEEVSAFVEALVPRVQLDATKPYAILHEKGDVYIGTADHELLSVKLALHGLGWAYADQPQATAAASGDSVRRFVNGTLNVPGTDGVLQFTQTASAEPDGALGLAYRLHFPQAVTLNGYQVSFTMNLDAYKGARIELDTPDGPKTLTVPAELGENFLHSGPVTGLTVAPDDPMGFSLTADRQSNLLIQDNRGWGGDSIELRFNFRRQESGELVPAGETAERKFTFRLNSPLQIVLQEAGATSETDTSDWVAYTLPWDSAPVDVSFLNHRPAGRFGFVQASDGKFVFADSSEEVRFWGTCFSAGANFPTHEQAEKIARRLARFGINMVRTHHADAPWAERHFFKKDADDTRQFDPESLDRFDYLLYCLKQEGIYIYLDQLVNRYFKAGDGVDAVENLEACAKPYSNFDPRLIELQKEFSKNLWSHVNPYTGLAYKDDPAIAMMEFANENDLFTQQVTLEPYRSRLEARFRRWAAERGVQVPEGDVDFTRKTDDIMRFLVDVQRDYYLEMQGYLRDEVGVRVPMTGSNWSRNAALLAALRDMDFTDSHTYWNHPSGENFGNTPMIAARSTFFGGLAFQRVEGKPFFISEWDEPWPNEWRAEQPCWVAAISALQGWNGLTVYTYRHTSSVPVDSLTGAFETFNDPARFGLFAHAALMYRRADVASDDTSVAVEIPEDLALSAQSPSAWSIGAYRDLSEIRRIETALYGARGKHERVLGLDDEVEATEGERVSVTGEIRRDIEKRVGLIDTARSQAVYGFLAEAGPMQTRDMTVDCSSLFATVALSSLSDAPIRDSESLLLAAVGRAENTGFQYNFTRKKRLGSGSGPILIDPIRATVSIVTARPDLRVHALAPDGSRSSEVPASYTDGRLTFDIGPEAKTMYYEIGR